MRPGRELGELLAGDLLGGVAEQFLGVLVPGADGARAVDLDDRDADPAVGDGQQLHGQGRSGRAGAHRAGGEVELEPDVLLGGGVLDAPAGGDGGAQQEAAAVLAVGACDLGGGGVERNFPFGVMVGDLDPDAVLGAQAEYVGGGARVDDRVGDELTGEDDGVVDDVRVPPALEGVADEGAGGRDGPPDGFEAGFRPRGDHRTPRTRLDGRFPLPGSGKVPPGINTPMCGPPPPVSRGRPCGARCAPGSEEQGALPPSDGPGRLDSRKPGYLPSLS